MQKFEGGLQRLLEKYSDLREGKRGEIKFELSDSEGYVSVEDIVPGSIQVIPIKKEKNDG